GAVAQLMVEMRDAGNRQLARAGELPQQMRERHRVAAARQRDNDARRRRREMMPPDRATDAVKHEGTKSAGGRIRTVDPALMRRVLSPTELPRQEPQIVTHGPANLPAPRPWAARRSFQ